VHGREQHALADFETSDVLADFDDFSGDVAAQNVRQLHAGQSFAHPDVEVIHGAGSYAHENLISARLRVGNVFVAKYFWPAKFVNTDGFHGNSRGKSSYHKITGALAIPIPAPENFSL
jgi:hypothetical protein